MGNPGNFRPFCLPSFHERPHSNIHLHRQSRLSSLGRRSLPAGQLQFSVPIHGFRRRRTLAADLGFSASQSPAKRPWRTPAGVGVRVGCKSRPANSQVVPRLCLMTESCRRVVGARMGGRARMQDKERKRKIRLVSIGQKRWREFEKTAMSMPSCAFSSRPDTTRPDTVALCPHLTR